MWSLNANCPPGVLNRVVSNLLITLNSFGVPIFFALSGYYILAKEYDDPLNFYCRRFIRIGVPYLIYAVVYVVYFVGIEQHTPAKIPLMYFVDILTGNVHGTHWFVYTILGMYLASPFLSKMFAKLSDKEVIILYLIGMVITLLNDIFSLFDYSFGIKDYTFSGFLLMFIGGYCLNRILNSAGVMDKFAKYKWLIFAVMFVMLYFMADSSFARAAGGAIVVTGNRKISVKPGAEKIITVMSSYSYSTYLMHAAVISLLLRLYTDWTHMYILKLFAGNFAVYLIAFVIVFAVDNIVTNRLMKSLLKDWKDQQI